MMWLQVVKLLCYGCSGGVNIVQFFVGCLGICWLLLWLYCYFLLSVDMDIYVVCFVVGYNCVLYWLKKEVLLLLVMLGLFVVVCDILVNYYQVFSGLMQYMLMFGDCVVVDMCVYGLCLFFIGLELMVIGILQCGDVVVFDLLCDGVCLIKCIVVVGGDWVDLCDGYLIINGCLLVDVSQGEVEDFGIYVVQFDFGQGGGFDIVGLIVLVGKVLMLGDYCGNSLDGCFFGLVEVLVLYGKVLYVYWWCGDGFIWQVL